MTVPSFIVTPTSLRDAVPYFAFSGFHVLPFAALALTTDAGSSGDVADVTGLDAVGAACACGDAAAGPEAVRAPVPATAMPAATREVARRSVRWVIPNGVRRSDADSSSAP